VIKTRFILFALCLLATLPFAAARAQEEAPDPAAPVAAEQQPAADKPAVAKPAADAAAAAKPADKPADKTSDKPADAAQKPADGKQVANAAQAGAEDEMIDDSKMEDMNTVQLRTIDKLSARTQTFDIPVDKTVKFGNSLFIKVRACREASPLARPEDAAFLQIWERKPAEEKSRWLFSGWMFSSSPSLSRLDHPVYDVWVIHCKNAPTSKSEQFSSETAPDAQPLSGKPEDIGFVEGAAPDKPATDTPPPAAKPATDAAPASKPVAAPAANPADKGKPAKPTVPPLDKLPGSFDDGKDTGGDDLPSGGD
jgi:hypothetical protein